MVARAPLQTTITAITQLNISWLSLLVSPTSFVFYLLFLVFALFFVMRKQVVPKISNGDFVERVIPGRVQYELWQEHINRYFFALKFVSGKIVLDVACGTGYGTELISKTAGLAIGVDISREAITYAKEHFGKHPNTAFVLSDACNLPFQGIIFDTVVSFETIEHLAHSDLFLHEISCVLKTNGTIIVSTPNGQTSSQQKEVPMSPFHLKEFNIEEFSKLLSLFFTNKQFYGQNYDTIKAWLLRFLGEHLPFSFKILFGRIRTSLLKPSMPQRGITRTIDPAYGVRKLESIHPIYNPHFFIVVAKNRKVIS